MSLYIIGSANRVTANIILQLARNGQYSSVTIADLLPTYEHHHRFYRLRRQIDNLQLNTSVNLAKITSVNDIYKHQQHSDVLFVTHDYYQHVTSKTKLMQITAQVCKSRPNLYFATPVEYDHYGFANPDANYMKAHNRVRQLAPQSTIIRSDVQDKNQALAYIKSSKGVIDGQLFNFYSNKNFAPRIVSSYHYANVVCNAMRDKLAGKSLLVQGSSTKSLSEIEINRDVEAHQWNHAAKNIAEMTSKYNGLIGEGCEKVAEAQE